MVKPKIQCPKTKKTHKQKNQNNHAQEPSYQIQLMGYQEKIKSFYFYSVFVIKKKYSQVLPWDRK